MSRLTAALPTASRAPNSTGNPVWLATALPKGKWTLPVIRKRDRRWVTSAASSASPCSAERSGANTGTMARLSIRTRLILLSGALLLFLLASNFYLNRKLAENADGMDRAAALLGMIEEANGAQIAFGEVRYWMTDLAVSLLAQSERNAAAARAQMESALDGLAQHRPRAVASIRAELAAYESAARRAVDEYVNDHRVVGNSFLAEASRHSVEVDRLLAAIVAELTQESLAARARVVTEARAATELSRIVALAAIVVGGVLTLLVLRSIAVPLRRLVIAMNGLNAGNLAVAIPLPGPDEIGAMARTLAAFRDTLDQLHRTLAQLEALRAVGRAVEFSGAAAGGVYEFDEIAQAFHFRTGHRVGPELAERLKAQPLRRGEGAVGRAATIGAPVQVPDLRHAGEADVPGLTDALDRNGYHSLLAAPLLHEETILGGLSVFRREAGRFPEETVGLVEAFAIQSALAVRNAKQFEALRQREAELRAAHEQLKAAQANLIQAEKMASLGQLTAGIAHEIKNPLNFVNNFAELSRELLDELRQMLPALAAGNDEVPAAPPEFAEILTTLDSNLEKIAEHGRRADAIVTSMLLHSRGGSGERRLTDLNSLLDEALNLSYHGARAQDRNFTVTLERHFDPVLQPIEIVPQDITRVFLNLFSNAFYAVSKRREAGDAAYQPTVGITTRERGEAVEIKVRDNGIGMPAATREQAFTPFFTTKPTGEGTGLGLSISYDIIVQQHQGNITIDSREGDFTEFTIRLARRSQTAGAPPVDAAIGAAR